MTSLANTTTASGTPARRGLGPGLAALALFVLAVGAAAATGGLFMPDEWYRGLAKPSFNPPNWVFGPVWSCLYLMMAVAAWLVWRERGLRGAAGALSLFFAQLVLNAAWTALFFGAHAIGWALVDIVLLWVLIAATLRAFYRVRPVAGLLLAPYLAWVSFATVLNFALWRLNA